MILRVLLLSACGLESVGSGRRQAASREQSKLKKGKKPLKMLEPKWVAEISFKKAETLSYSARLTLT